jgi:hypothetical protein
MDTPQIRFWPLAAKTIVAHTVTYFFMGVLASTLLDYAAAFARPEMACWMRQFDDPWIMAGPLFQPIRGLIFALVFYPLRSVLFGRRNGWLLMWWMLVALGVLSTFGPAPGSVEGMLYTRLPILGQLKGWLEVVPQALLLSVWLYYWVIRPPKKWLNWTLGILFFLLMLMPVLGLMARNTH